MPQMVGRRKGRKGGREGTKEGIVCEIGDESDDKRL